MSPSQILIGALLTTGLDQKAYHDLIADIEEIAMKLRRRYDLLGPEIVENFMSAATPDAAAREAFLHRILWRASRQSMRASHSCSARR